MSVESYVSPLASKQKKLEKTVEGIHAVLYGKPKSGKTYSLDDENMKVLLLDMDKGSAVLRGAKNVTALDIDTWEDLEEAFKLINKGYWINDEGKLVPFAFDLVVGDSFTRMQDLAKDYVVREIAPNRKRETAYFGAQSDWGDLNKLLIGKTSLAQKMTKRGEKSINFMWIAHEEFVKDEVTEAVMSTKIQLQGKTTATDIMSIVDANFYAFKKRNEEGNMEYGILTQAKGIAEANVRIAKNQEPLPDIIMFPKWSEIFTKLGYKVTQHSKKQRQEKGDK